MEIASRDGGVSFYVRLQPRASRDAIERKYGGVLRIRLTATLWDGRANGGPLRLLAERLNAPRAAVRIVAGEKRRRKRVDVAGVRREPALALLSPATRPTKRAKD